jgi:putative hydrolase of the HAD superfamily
LVQFIAKRGGDPAWVSGALEEMSAPLPPHFAIPTTPNAKEILKLLHSSHLLALVTGGHPPFQLEKLEKAGIDRTFFSKIAIPEDSIKKPFYEGLMKEFSIPASQVLVCGDRVAMDLAPAYELGFTTVHMRWGRGQLAETEKWIHHAIADLSELIPFIKRIVKI